MAIDPATLALYAQIGLPIAGGLYNTIFPNKVKQIQMEVIDSMRDRRKRLVRMARGNFTPAERQDIRKGAEPGLNRLAGNLAQRGLGTSGAGAQVMAQAQVQPFTEAQANAEQMVGQADTSITAALAAIPDKPDIMSGLGSLAGKFYEIEKLKMLQAEETGEPAAGENVFEGFLQGLMDFLQGFGAADDVDEAMNAGFLFDDRHIDAARKL